MKFYGSPRTSGKTQACIEWLEKNPDAVLLVHDERYARHLIETHEVCTENNVIPATRATRLLGQKTGPVGIDNVDLVLENLFHRQIEFATYRSDPGKKNPLMGGSRKNNPKTRKGAAGTGTGPKANR